jgi:hypothetical protein
MQTKKEMKKPIIGAKKKASKARMAEVKKIPSRGLAPTKKEVAKKNAASEVQKMKPQGISRKVNFPESHYGDVINQFDGDTMQHMKNHGTNIRKAADANRKKRSANAGPVKMQNKIKRLPDNVVKRQVVSDEVSKIKPQGIKSRDTRNMNQSNMAIAIEDGDANYFKKEANIASAAAKKAPARKSMLSPVQKAKFKASRIIAKVKNKKK